jgi:hypothetical protein
LYHRDTRPALGLFVVRNIDYSRVADSGGG